MCDVFGQSCGGQRDPNRVRRRTACVEQCVMLRRGTALRAFLSVPIDTGHVRVLVGMECARRSGL